MKKEKTDKRLEELKANSEIFFNFMKEKYPLYFNSNIFFRDVQYAIERYFEMKETPVTYSEAEKLTIQFTEHLTASGQLVELNPKSWKVNFSFDKPEPENSTEESVTV